MTAQRSAYFIASVQKLGRMESKTAAEAVTKQVMRNLGMVLGRRQSEEITAMLPSEIAEFLQAAPEEPDTLIDQEIFIGPLMDLMDNESLYDENLGGMDLVSSHREEQLAEQVQAVFGAMSEVVDDEALRSVETMLPAGVDLWLQRARERNQRKHEGNGRV